MKINNGMTLRPQINPKEMDKKLQEVSEGYEKIFLNELVKSMRKSVTESDFLDTGSAGKIYREQLDQEYINSWSQRGGLGIKEMVHEHLLRQYGEKLGLKLPEEKIQQKNNLVQSDFFKLSDVIKPEDENGSKKVFSSESGVLVSKKRLSDDNQWLLTLKTKIQDQPSLIHISFKGVLDKNLQEGQIVSPGQRLGTLSPDSDKFFVKNVPASQVVSE
jgi:flagellar protein FlgJ